MGVNYTYCGDSFVIHTKSRDFPGGAVVKNPPANSGGMGLSPGPTCRRATKPMRHNY